MSRPAWRRLSDGTSRGRLEALRTAVTDLLGGNYLPTFTDHSVAHSDRLCDLIDELSSPLTVQLIDREAFVLYAAAYLHDAGLQHQRAGETKIVRDILIERYGETAWNDLDTQTRHSIVRDQHHRISGEMITQSINAAYPTVIGIQLTDEWDPGQIRALAIAHNLCMDGVDREEYEKLTTDWGGTRMSLLSALLRLADILDESRRRSRRFLELTRDLPCESRMHWWRHYYVAEVEIKPADHKITLWFDFPPARRGQYREMIPPLQVPWIRAEFDRQADVLARNTLLWHFSTAETPEFQSTASPMDDELERFVLEKLASERVQRAEQDRLVVLQQLRVERPTIERQLAELRTNVSANEAPGNLRRFKELASHLFRLGGCRDAWITLLSEYNRSSKLVDLSLRFEIATALAEMMLADDSSESAVRVLRELRAEAETLQQADRYRFAALYGRALLEECVYDEALEWLQRSANMAPGADGRDQELALLEEAKLLQGDFISDTTRQETK